MEPQPSSSISPVQIWSDGLRLAGEFHLPINPPEPPPVVLMCHGWGGVKEQLRPYGKWFAKHGIASLSFDYRGWGESDGKIVLTGQPLLTSGSDQTATCTVVREIVDPRDQLRDIASALDYLSDEPRVNPRSIGVFGSSFGAGLALTTAALDARIRCFVGQAGGYGVPTTPAFATEAARRASARARGDISDLIVTDGSGQSAVTTDAGHWVFPVPASSLLIGGADLAGMRNYQPRDLAHLVNVPCLFLEVEQEEIVDLNQHGHLVYERVKDRVEAETRSFPGTHYAIYESPTYFAACGAALDWFTKHLRSEADEDAVK